jgi:asparagine synthase (glutamine-hydrolysing)
MLRHVVADVPLALFLSGGIDSGILASELGHCSGAQAKAVSVVLETRGTEDEQDIVRAHAKSSGLDVHLVTAADWGKRIVAAPAAFDQPSVDGLNTFLVAGVARDLGFKVALSGVGADEVFGGYNHFHARFGRIPSLPGTRLAGLVVGERLAKSLSLPVRRVGLMLAGHARGENQQRARRRIFSDGVIRALVGEVPSLPDGLPEDPLLLEQQTYLLNTLLRDTDIMGMAHGVEIRAPFLDPEVIGAARAVGTRQLLASDKPPKWILRKGWSDFLDRKAVTRRKTGFTMDLANWLNTTGSALVEEAHVTLAKSVAQPRLLEAIWRRSVSELDRGHASAWVRTFGLVQLAEQFRRWGIAV